MPDIPIKPASRSAALNAAAQTKEQQIGRLRADHLALINELVDKPESNELLQRIAGVELELSRANAAVETLQLAAEAAKVREAEEATAARRVATKDLREKTIKRAQDRQQLAANVDAAGEALIEAIKAWRSEGQAIAIDAHRVLVAVQPAEAARLNYGGQVMPHAHGTQAVFAYALGDLIRRAVAAFDVSAMNDVLIVNHFVATAGCTFVGGNPKSVEVIKSRL